MRQPDRVLFEGTPFHTHSELTRQIEEMENHAVALTDAGDQFDDILADLTTFSAAFADDVYAHIEEEESAFFTACADELDPRQRKVLDELYRQHDALKRSLTLLLTFLGELTTTSDAANTDVDPDLLELIIVHTKQMRYSFALHSMREEDFLRSLTEK